jgi:hypothetical protein
MLRHAVVEYRASWYCMLFGNRRMFAALRY